MYSMGLKWARADLHSGAGSEHKLLQKVGDMCSITSSITNSRADRLTVRGIVLRYI